MNIFPAPLTPQWVREVERNIRQAKTDIQHILKNPQGGNSDDAPPSGGGGTPLDIANSENSSVKLAQATANIALGSSGNVTLYDGFGSSEATNSGSVVSAFARNCAVANGDFVYVVSDDEDVYEIVSPVTNKLLRAVAQSSAGPGSNVTVKLYAGFGTSAILATQTTTVYTAALYVISGFTIYVARGLDGNYEVVEADRAVVGQTAGSISAGSLSSPPTTNLTVYRNGASTGQTVVVKNYNPGLSAVSGKSAGAVWNGVEWVWSWVDC